MSSRDESSRVPRFPWQSGLARGFTIIDLSCESPRGAPRVNVVARSSNVGKVVRFFHGSEKALNFGLAPHGLRVSGRSLFYRCFRPALGGARGTFRRVGERDERTEGWERIGIAKVFGAVQTDKAAVLWNILTYITTWEKEREGKRETQREEKLGQGVVTRDCCLPLVSLYLIGFSFASSSSRLRGNSSAARSTCLCGDVPPCMTWSVCGEESVESTCTRSRRQHVCLPHGLRQL